MTDNKRKISILVCTLLVFMIVLLTFYGFLSHQADIFIEKNSSQKLQHLVQQIDQPYKMRLDECYDRMDRAESFLFSNENRSIVLSQNQAYLTHESNDKTSYIFFNLDGTYINPYSQVGTIDIETVSKEEFSESGKITQIIKYNNESYFLVGSRYSSFYVDGQEYEGIGLLYPLDEFTNTINLYGYDGKAKIYILGANNQIVYDNQSSALEDVGKPLLDTYLEDSVIDQELYDDILNTFKSKIYGASWSTLKSDDQNYIVYRKLGNHYKLLCNIDASVLQSSLISFSHIFLNIYILGAFAIVGLMLLVIGMVIKIVKNQKQREATEEKNALLEMEKQQAERANESKSLFLSSVSHDIRTPINGIQGMLKIADAYPSDMIKQKECRQKMWVATNYLVSLVNNVLNINRLENKSLELKAEPFNLIDLLMNLSTMSDIQANAEGIYLHVDWKPDYIQHRYLIGSADGLIRILMNLVNNSIKYNKKNGSIYVKCVEVESDEDIAWFEFTNKDTGIGMSEEFASRAFDKYSQENKSETINTLKGVGLGLAIVKQTVEAMHGTISLDSKLNEGTTFTICLPFKIDKNPKMVQQHIDNISLEGIRVLLVEDNDLNLEIAKFLLEKHGMCVETATDGLKALKMFEESDPNYYQTILMDIMMPTMDGLQATRKIRMLNREDARRVPILAMSANAFDIDIEKSLEAGMNAHLTKPLDENKIMETIKKYIFECQ